MFDSKVGFLLTPDSLSRSLGAHHAAHASDVDTASFYELERLSEAEPNLDRNWELGEKSQKDSVRGSLERSDECKRPSIEPLMIGKHQDPLIIEPLMNAIDKLQDRLVFVESSLGQKGPIAQSFRHMQLHVAQVSSSNKDSIDQGLRQMQAHVSHLSSSSQSAIDENLRQIQAHVSRLSSSNQSAIDQSLKQMQTHVSQLSTCSQSCLDQWCREIQAHVSRLFEQQEMKLETSLASKQWERADYLMIKGDDEKAREVVDIDELKSEQKDDGRKGGETAFERNIGTASSSTSGVVLESALRQKKQARQISDPPSSAPQQSQGSNSYHARPGCGVPESAVDIDSPQSRKTEGPVVYTSEGTVNTGSSGRDRTDRTVSFQDVNPDDDRKSFNAEKNNEEINNFFHDPAKGLDFGTLRSDMSWQARAVKHVVHRQSCWHAFLKHFGYIHVLPTRPPKQHFHSAVLKRILGFLRMMLTLGNACLMAYEADLAVQLATRAPREEVPHWIGLMIRYFTIAYAVEVGLRVIFLRWWFFVSPRDWPWNLFDVCLVILSVLSDFVYDSANLSFFRIIRVTRLAQMIKLFKAFTLFRHVRIMTLSMMASFGALLWAFCFLAVIVFFFAIIFLHGINEHMRSSGYSEAFFQSCSRWYSSLPGAMHSLLIVVIGGADGTTIMAPLIEISPVYTGVFTFYVMFVVVGVLNVVTSIFLQNAQGFNDRDITIHNELQKFESFVVQMLELFAEMNPGRDVLELFAELDDDHEGTVTWEVFLDFLDREEVEAFLAAHMLETSHARSLFKMLDRDRTGVITVSEFVIGMWRLKGPGKSYDNRWMLHQLYKIKHNLKCVASTQQYMCRELSANQRR